MKRTHGAIVNDALDCHVYVLEPHCSLWYLPVPIAWKASYCSNRFLMFCLYKGIPVQYR